MGHWRRASFWKMIVPVVGSIVQAATYGSDSRGACVGPACARAGAWRWRASASRGTSSVTARANAMAISAPLENPRPTILGVTTKFIPTPQGPLSTFARRKPSEALAAQVSGRHSQPADSILRIWTANEQMVEKIIFNIRAGWLPPHPRVTAVAKRMQPPRRFPSPEARLSIFSVFRKAVHANAQLFCSLGPPRSRKSTASKRARDLQRKPASRDHPTIFCDLGLTG